MLDKNVIDLLNQQVNKEFYSAYLYLEFSNFYYDQGLEGFGSWFKIQAQEERDHAMLFIQYLPVSYTHLYTGIFLCIFVKKDFKVYKGQFCPYYSIRA